MQRNLNKIAKQVTKLIWKKLNETKKLAKQDSTADLLAALKEQYHITVVDQTKGDVPLRYVLQQFAGILDTLSASGTVVRDALNGHSLMTVVLYSGDEIDEGHYAGGMADYEVDEATLYLAVGRVMQNESQTLQMGAHNVGKDFRSVVAHEIGHVIMQPVEDVIGSKIAIIFDEEPKEYWENRISEYAGKSDHEMFAEAFAAYTHPDYKMGMLPSLIEEIFVRCEIEPSVSKLQKAGQTRTTGVTTAAGSVVYSASDIDDILDSIDDADWFIVEGTVSPALLQMFQDAGYTELAGTDSASSKALFTAIDERAQAYADQRAAQLVTDISYSTRNMLRGTIEDALSEGWDRGELADEIENTYAFGEVRSGVIANNELAMAHSYGRIDAAKDAGAIGKIWLLSDDHDDNEDCSCTEAADAGTVDLDELFVPDDDDYDFPPGHVNCMCDWSGVYPGDEDDDSDEDDEDDEDSADKVLKYSPDQPRDSHGRFGEGLYGENSSRYESLIKGFNPSEELATALHEYAERPTEGQARIEQGIKEEGVQLEQGTMLYRGLSMDSDKDVKAAFKDGNRLQPLGVQSTSIEKSVAEEFSGSTGNVGVMVSIKCDHELKCMPVPRSGQSELVLSKNAVMYVIGNPSKQDGVWHVNAIAKYNY